MTTLTWPASWLPSGWELRLAPNVRQFTSPYSGGTQVLDLGGERWRAVLTLPPALTAAQGYEREAFFDQLAGGLNDVALWHFRLPSPRGTFAAAAVAFTWTNGGAFTWTNGGAFTWTAGTPVLRSAVVEGAQACTLQSLPGRTALAGDMVGIGGELKRVLADATADGSGLLALSFAPRARTDWTAYSTAVVTLRPTATFKLTGDVPTQWAPGAAAGAQFEALEVINT